MTDCLWPKCGCSERDTCRKPASDYAELVAELEEYGPHDQWIVDKSLLAIRSLIAERDSARESNGKLAGKVWGLAVRAEAAERTRDEMATKYGSAAKALADAESLLAKAREGLQQITANADQVQIFYDKNGPEWTSRESGQEYYSASSLLNFAEEIATTARAALEQKP